MMLERGGVDEQGDDTTTRIAITITATAIANVGKIIVGEHDPLRNTRRTEPIQVCNRFDVFTVDDDGDSAADDDNDAQHASNQSA